MNFIGNMAKGAAETAWFGAQFGLAPCHAVTPVAMLRVTFWGVGFQKVYKWYVVSVTFGPCAPRGNPGDAIPMGQIIPNQRQNGVGNPGGANSGAVPFGDANPNTASGPASALTATAVSHPYNNPNLSIRASQISSVLGGRGQLGTTIILPTAVFSSTGLANLQSLQSLDAQAIQSAYWNGDNGTTFPSNAWNPNLTSTWGTPQPPATTTGSTGTTTTTSTSPPPTPPPSSKPTLGSRK